MYQKCPVCRGKGVFKKETCPVCLGEHIIHEEYGTPPSKTIVPYLTIQQPSYPWFPLTPTEPFYITSTLPQEN